MTTTQKLFVCYVIAINVIAYLLMCCDKYQSKKKGRRISENNLFFMAFVLGASGVYFGMMAPVYHKSAKTKFKIGIPLLLVLNVISVYFIYKHCF